MKRVLTLFIVLIGMLSACGGAAAVPTATSTDVPTQLALVLPSATGTAVLLPAPTTIWVATNTPLPYPVQTQRPDCNQAELIAQGYVAESGETITPGAEFSVILRLTNQGTCTWTTEYTVTLVENQGLAIEDQQNFSGTAVPGQTVDLLIKVTAPEEPGSYTAAWRLQNPGGDMFGYGQDGQLNFNLILTLNGGRFFVAINELIFPSEVCSNEPKQYGLPRYARLMHDPQWMPWLSRMGDPDWPRGFHYDWYPETVQLWTRPRGGDGRVSYSKDWLRYLRAIQPDDETAVWIARINAGLFNTGNDFIPILNLSELKEDPIAEGISSGGNVIKVVEFYNDSMRIEMLYVKDSPPNVNTVNYQRRPWLVTKFTSVSVEGELGNAGGIDVYFPNLSKQAEGYWVDNQRVEWFPTLPVCAQVKLGLSVRFEPWDSAVKKGILVPGQQVVVREYSLRGSDVWGRIREGWILLVHQEQGQPVYPTSWWMETRPPIVFD